MPIEGVEFQPRFVTWACPRCDPEYKKQNCYSDGKYCAMQHSEVENLDGVEILNENLVQHCVFQLTELRTETRLVPMNQEHA